MFASRIQYVVIPQSHSPPLYGAVALNPLHIESVSASHVLDASSSQTHPVRSFLHMGLRVEQPAWGKDVVIEHTEQVPSPLQIIPRPHVPGSVPSPFWPSILHFKIKVVFRCNNNSV